MTSPVKLVIFDCDGTIVDSQHTIVAAMEAAFRTTSLEPPPRHQILSVVGLSLVTAVERLLPRDIDPEFAVGLAETYKASFAARRARHDHAEPLYPGIRETIERLSLRGDVLLGIATGKSIRGVTAVLERERLTTHFATIQTADTHPSKPHPAMLLQAMLETEVGAEDTIMIGDTTYDIEMARDAGAVPVGVAWGYHPVQALHAAGALAVVNDSIELDGLLERKLSTSEIHSS